MQLRFMLSGVDKQSVSPSESPAATLGNGKVEGDILRRGLKRNERSSSDLPTTPRQRLQARNSSPLTPKKARRQTPYSSHLRAKVQDSLIRNEVLQDGTNLVQEEVIVAGQDQIEDSKESGLTILRDDAYFADRLARLVEDREISPVRPTAGEAVDTTLSEITMNYQPSPIDTQNGQMSNRQAPASPSSNMANGVNGGGGMAYGMATIPTPAGHQADLNNIMSMVEKLSEQLEANRKITGNITAKMDTIRQRAADGDLSNEELLVLTSDSINSKSCASWHSKLMTAADTRNIAEDNANLRGALEKAIYDRDENWKLVLFSANVLSDTLTQVHAFREREDERIHAWHRSYRTQLDEERRRNLELNHHITDMQGGAARAMDWLRKATRAYDDNDEMHELRVENHNLRGQIREWKRMAMPYADEDSGVFSDTEEYRKLPDEVKLKCRRERDATAAKYGRPAGESGLGLWVWED